MEPAEVMPFFDLKVKISFRGMVRKKEPRAVQLQDYENK